METRDYLLRQIRALAKAVARIAALIEDEKFEDALEGIVAGLRSLVGVSPEVLARLSADALVPLLTGDQGLVVSRALGVVEYLQLAERLSEEPSMSHAYRRGMVRVLALVSEAGEEEFSPPLLERLSRQIYLNQLEPGTLRRLLAHFEKVGRYDRSEDVVHAWLDVDLDTGFEAGMAFYERMWGRPEADCAAGGLVMSDVLEGIQELQRRAGRK